MTNDIKIKKEILERLKLGGQRNSPANLQREYNLDSKQTIELIRRI